MTKCKHIYVSARLVGDYWYTRCGWCDKPRRIRAGAYMRGIGPH